MRKIVICLVLACLLCPLARAVTLIESLGGLSSVGGGTESLGYRFTLNTSVTVISLGYFDVGSDGLSTSHQVGLWNAAGVLLTQATVTPASPSTGGFLYAALATPITLPAGNDYYLAGQISGDSWVYDVGSYTINSAFTYTGSYFASDSPSGLVFPSQSAVADSREYFNVNLQTGVPEPAQSVMILLGLALLALACLRRGRASGSPEAV